MSHLQNLTRKLTAAGYSRSHDGKFDHLLVVDEKSSALRCQRWFGDELLKEDVVAASVRPGSTAALLTTLTDSFVVYITAASTLGASTFNERERQWTEADEKDKNAPPAYIVEGTGKVVGLADGGGRIHIVFQDSSDRLRYLDHSWNLSILPVQPVSGSPLALLAVADSIHVFYVCAEDHCLHAAVSSDSSWEDVLVCEQPFKTRALSFVAEETSSGIEVLVLMKNNVLLKVTATKPAGDVGTLRKGRKVHGCVNHAWNGTLADANLQFYLKRDGTGCVDRPGGDHGFTPLAAACITGRLSTVHLLLQNGANPNALSSQKRTPLFFATTTKETRDRCAIVRALLDAGANVDDSYAETGHATPLMNAITVSRDRDVVVELLKHGANPETSDSKWRTPAEVAREMGMGDLFPMDDAASTETSFGQSPLSPRGVGIIPSTVGTSVRMMSPDPVPVLKRSTRRISEELNRPADQEDHVLGEAEGKQKASVDAERPSAFEAKVVDFLAALLMLFVNYTGSAKVKDAMDQAAVKLINARNEQNGKDDRET